MQTPFKYGGKSSSDTGGNTTSTNGGFTEEQVMGKAKSPFDGNPPMLNSSYFAVVDPVILGQAIPDEFKKDGIDKTAPRKNAFDTFDDFGKASRFAQRQNRNLVILEIKPCATVTPTLPVVDKLGVK